MLLDCILLRYKVPMKLEKLQNFHTACCGQPVTIQLIYYDICNRTVLVCIPKNIV